ncbi:MAG: hypothetical protein WC799_03810 [Desulfobacteraceae bacterium]
MKIKPNLFIMFFTLAAMAFSLVACDTRPIPGDLILSTYNSDMEATREFAPMDTLYVKIAGMKANSFYRISALDADNNLIAKIEARTNEDGVIDPTPLWYDMGLKVDEEDNTLPPTLVWPDGIQPGAFKINVKSLYDNGDSTDFTQDMWIVYTKAADDTNPKPVVYSCAIGIADAKAMGTFYPENAFKETGTIDINGNEDPKTQVYVKADRVPTKIGNNVTVTAVDFYVLRFTGDTFKNGDNLYDTDKFVVRRTAVPVVDGSIDGTLLWDLNDEPTLVNPNQDNMAYSIVMDVDRDGVYDQGMDTDSDGISDHFIDGVDGNGSPGFIVQNTPANDVFVTIKDENGNQVNAITENNNTVNKQLYINIDNVPVAADDEIAVYLIPADQQSGDNQFDVPADEEDIRVIASGDIDIPLSTPGAGDPRYLPFLANRALLNTKTVTDNYSYDGVEITSDKKLDLVVDLYNDGDFDPGIDILIEDAITILDVPATAVYKTCTDAAGLTMSQFFDETNTANGDTVVYLNAVQEGAQLPYDVYVIKDRNWVEGDYLSGELFSVTGLSGSGTNAIWDLNGTYQLINPTMDNNTYDIVVDNNMSGTYDGGDTILTVVILNTQVNTYPRLSYVNIASGGSFGNIWDQHWTIYSEFCDYRDVFIKSGLDTNPYGAGYGIKAVFNPYFSWFCAPEPEYPIAGLYYGLYVDVYIVNAATFDLSVFGHPGELNDTIDVTGQHSTLVVQPSCYNGAGMMNIWPAEMTPGSYYVIVDVNRNGRIDEGVDIIDAVKEDGTTILDDPMVVGFRVE